MYSQTGEKTEISRSFKGGSFALIGLVSQRVVSFLSGIIVARTIGPQAYGVFSAARSFSESFINLTKLGFDLGLVRRYSEARAQGGFRHLSYLLWAVIIIVLALSLIVIVWIYLGGGRFLEKNVFRYRGFSDAVMVIILALPLMSVSQVLGGAFRGILNIKPGITAQMLIQPWARLLIIVALFLSGWRLRAVLWGTVLSFLISACYLIHKARRHLLSGNVLRPSPLDLFGDLVKLSRYSIVLSLSLSVANLLRKTDILMLAHFVTSAETGRYAVIQMVASLIPLFNTAFSQLLGPEIAGAYAQREVEHMKKLIRRHIRWVTITSLPIFLALVVFGNGLLTVFGARFSNPSLALSQVILFLALSNFIVAVFSSTGFLLSMTGRHTLEFLTLFFTLTCNVTLNYLLIPRFGIAGAALSTLLSTCLGNAIRLSAIFISFRLLPLGKEAMIPMAVGLISMSPFFVFKYTINLKAQFFVSLVLSSLFIISYAVMVSKYCLSRPEKALIIDITNFLRARFSRS